MNVLHTFLMLVFVFYTAKAFLQREEFGEIFTKLVDECRDICTDISDVSDEAIFQVRDGNFIDDIKIKKYIQCMYRVSKLMDKNLNMNETLLDEVLPKKAKENDFKGMARNCLSEAKKSDIKENHEKVYRFEKLHDLKPEVFIMA
ncbi:uncharacterized protein [Leptinotarsa decemlineata]|uniref:uncharacterized protein n=1 Tax=Leptinotarsa decemlineata TaxID=7539 RepID=UPI003D30C6C6